MNDDKNDKNDKKSAKDQQPRAEEVVRAEPGQHPNPEVPEAKEVSGRDAGEIVLERLRWRTTLEIKGPPGMAVSVSGDEWCTKIAMRLPMAEWRSWTP